MGRLALRFGSRYGNDGPPTTDGQRIDSERRLYRMQVENRDIGGLWRRESNRNQHLFELITPPAASDVLRRVPDADDEKSAIPDCAVVPQLARTKLLLRGS